MGNGEDSGQPCGIGRDTQQQVGVAGAGALRRDKQRHCHPEGLGALRFGQCLAFIRKEQKNLWKNCHRTRIQMVAQLRKHKHQITGCCLGLGGARCWREGIAVPAKRPRALWE
jgi:hypothetical protein